jgi:hypothetical protein
MSRVVGGIEFADVDEVQDAPPAPPAATEPPAPGQVEVLAPGQKEQQVADEIAAAAAKDEATEDEDSPPDEREDLLKKVEAAGDAGLVDEVKRALSTKGAEEALEKAQAALDAAVLSLPREASGIEFVHPALNDLRAEVFGAEFDLYSSMPPVDIAERTREATLAEEDAAVAYKKLLTDGYPENSLRVKDALGVIVEAKMQAAALKKTAELRETLVAANRQAEAIARAAIEQQYKAMDKARVDKLIAEKADSTALAYARAEVTIPVAERKGYVEDLAEEIAARQAAFRDEHRSRYVDRMIMGETENLVFDLPR